MLFCQNDKWHETGTYRLKFLSSKTKFATNISFIDQDDSVNMISGKVNWHIPLENGNGGNANLQILG